MRAGPPAVVRAPRTVHAEHRVATLAEHELLALVDGALGDHVPPLACHQVQQLVHDEAGREAADTPSWNGDRLSTDGASQRCAVTPETSRNYSMMKKKRSKFPANTTH